MNGSTRSTRSSARGFTLLELVVGMALSTLIAAAAALTFSTVRNSAAESGTRAQLDRDARVVLDMLERDLAYFGAGIPSGSCIDQGCAGIDLLPVLRVAASDGLVFLGDAPYPNAELNGAMTVAYGGNHVLAGGAANDIVAVSSEVSGSCVPHNIAATAANRCSSKASTLVPGVYADADCSEGNTGARTCPWAMGKLQGAAVRSHVVVATANGDWYRRMWDGAFEADESPPHVTLHFAHNPDEPSVFIPNAERYTFLSQPDRVFWSFQGNTLSRNQCWGPHAAPNAPGFPLETTTAPSAPTDPLACTPGSEGTGWETIATGVTSLSFRYFQNPTTELSAPLAGADLARVRLLQVDMTLERKAPAGRVLRRNVRQLFFLANREQDAP
jgi:prepilin-type N-terminal cleavage/methylation domain-containing protein